MDQIGHYEQDIMINVPASPGIKWLGKVCERLCCGERKVSRESRGADTLSTSGYSSARAFKLILSAPCQQ